MIRKHKLITVLAVLLLPLGILTCLKWNTWFGQVYEDKYTIELESISRVVLSFGENAESSASISWQGDKQAKVHYLILNPKTDSIIYKAKADIITTQGGVSSFYKVDLENLDCNTDYTYRITNNTKSSLDYSFRLNKDSTDLSFVYIGDIQEKKNGMMDSIFAKIQHNNSNVDFWAFGGDMIERPLEKYWKVWFKSIKPILGNIPLIACTGNHEYHKGITKTLDKRYTHHFPFPKNGSEHYKGRSCYWNFDDVLFVSIDTDGICTPLNLYEQYYWLKDILEKDKSKWKVVMMHHPVRSLRKSRLNVASAFFLKGLLEDNKVDLVLQGHDHGYARLSEEGKPSYIISSCSNKYYDSTRKEGWTKIIPGKKLYQLIKINKKRLSYESFDIEKGLVDSFIKTK